jgi:serine/threonine-protein kinase
MPNAIGQKIDRYQILDQLGQGGMATVYKARDSSLDRDVAIKVIRLEAFAPAQLNQFHVRFKLEAKLLARLAHFSIVTADDCGEPDGELYFVFEYCPRGDLKIRLTGTPMD